jgi:hypothetical protein
LGLLRDEQKTQRDDAIDGIEAFSPSTVSHGAVLPQMKVTFH